VVRLGKFNIDTRQTDSFLGLATPAASLFVVGLLMINYFDAPIFAQWLDSEVFLIISCVVLSGLMISEIPMFSFKVHGMMWKGNESRVIFLVLCIPAILILKWAALPFVILLYILISILEYFIGSGSDAVTK
jgi:CDP-diacylglycerol--serine O-phosphatidyltransferase